MTAFQSPTSITAHYLCHGQELHESPNLQISICMQTLSYALTDEMGSLGEQASHQSVLHPDTPEDALPTVNERRLSTSSTRYRRVQSSTRYT